MKETWKNLKFAWIYTKDNKRQVIEYIISNIFSIIISIIVPILSARVIISLTSNELMQLLFICIIIFIVENCRNLTHNFSRYFSQIIYRESFIKIQTALGIEILKLENESLDETSSGVFIKRLTNDTSRLADIFNVLNTYLKNIITDMGIFGAIFIINKTVFLLVVALVLLQFLIQKKKTTLYNERDKEFRKLEEGVAGFVGELVRGIRDIKMLNAEHSFINELHSKVETLNSKRYEMQDTDRRYSLLGDFTYDLSDLLLIFLIVILIYNGNLTIANALIIYNYTGRMGSIIYNVGTFMDKVKDFNLSASRIFEIINSDKFKKEHFGNKSIKKIKGDFTFKDVTFGYKDTPVLNKINFEVKANETVAFVGKSGAGKTTIFNLLCKMYEPTSGEILIDGINIEDLDKDSIRGNITIISQNPYIFNLSIKDNLRLVKENLTEKEMKKACDMACLTDFIEELPDKYDTIIGEGGVNLSGGQKQRLAIARAFVQKTEIILFDEATSALDNETQSKIQEAIENMKNQYTIMIIAHRLSTVINADRIFVLNEGKIEAVGSHNELLKSCNIYQELYNTELKK